MELIAHRINTAAELNKLNPRYGVELDLRDNFDHRIYLQHNPFEPGEDFEEYLKAYRHGTMILNVKSERIEYQVLEMLQQRGISNYFFLDSTFPMIKALSDQGENRIAIRYSECEGLDTVRAMQGKCKWVWVDCFTRLPLDRKIYLELKAMDYNLCMVSPELEGHQEDLEQYAADLKRDGIHFDAICTKSYNIERWESLLKTSRQ